MADAVVYESLNRIARAHGFQRSGRVIQDRVLEIARRQFHVKRDPIGGFFVWPDKETAKNWSRYRTLGSEECARRIEVIAFEELRAAIPPISTGDIPAEVARVFGIRRLATAARSRLEAVIKESAQETRDNED